MFLPNEGFYFNLKYFIATESKPTCGQSSKTGNEINSILPCIELPFKLFPFMKGDNAMNVHILERIFDSYLFYNHKILIRHYKAEVCYSHQITEL